MYLGADVGMIAIADGLQPEVKSFLLTFSF
jgi:hypothetical protein